MKYQDALLEEFVASFGKLDELWTSREIDPIAWDFGIDEPDQYGDMSWRPRRVSTNPSALEGIYAKLPGRFPPLFERLVLSYRWAEVQLELLRLLPNPLGADLSGLFSQISRDQALWESLIPKGYIQFGRGPDVDYDPVCFDTSRRKKNRDCPIVKFDHEEILCNNRLKLVSELAPSFEDLVHAVIREATKK